MEGRLLMVPLILECSDCQKVPESYTLLTFLRNPHERSHGAITHFLAD